ncbi:hypothetical protein [Candidatus Cetobacterium colombiensis]|uniref:Uncharacterized protein n=1 Tax=Candidatus Cetobacterium colombiensis TaxID=3073100 RepID=A0ABU4WCZ7_9FUSO|nr:hypothetical protein [Candidatus Cetobacterium colombiensis]MDX8337397.1 hypothetical protein [Candidatus Cetobacterium colombiensis]
MLDKTFLVLKPKTSSLLLEIKFVEAIGLTAALNPSTKDFHSRVSHSSKRIGITDLKSSKTARRISYLPNLN